MTSGPQSGTLTAHHPDSGRAVAPAADYLFLVLEGNRPRAGGARIRLNRVSAVSLGRGERRAVSVVEDSPHRRVLVVELPDRRLSSRHARLERGLAGWELHDAGSKNGTFVNGVLTTRAPLTDGDTIEIGHCLLVYRDALPAAGDAVVVDAADAASGPRGTASLRPDVAHALARLARLAGGRAPVLLRGDTGTGKEVLARALHELSGRSGAFVAVNCGAIPEALVESELFGHRKGSFTGALADRLGHLRAADGGTLLLDEIGELPAAAQAALLRALTEREVTPVGATQPVPVDFQLISATHRDLEAMTDRGEFRGDLFARINGFAYHVPPLRDRIEDLGVVIPALLADAETAAGIDIAALRCLYRYDWPRNIRELGMALEAARVLAAGGPIGVDHLPEQVTRAAAEADVTDLEDRARRTLLVKLLREHRGNVSAVARSTGKGRTQIQRWLKRYHLDPDRFR